MKPMRTGMGRTRRRCSVALVVIFAVGGLGACGGSGAGKAVDRDGVTQIPTDEYVVLVPHVLGGEGGWCMVRPRAIFGPGPCEESPGVGPILAESWTVSSGGGSGSSGSEAPVAKGVAVTTSAVASVSVNGGRPSPTRSEAVLPSGVRAVSVELRGSTQPKSEFEFALPKTRRRFTPLNSHGLAIPQTGAGSLLSFKTPASTWRFPDPEPAGLCMIASNAVDGLRALGGTVATRLASADEVPGEPMLSCISVRYGGGGFSLIASVLLDARRPGRAPGVLPTARLISGRPGVYSALGDAGAMVARRIPGAWLVVSGGDSQEQRIRLSMRLDAAVRERVLRGG
jgi:hypothetical protein